MNYKDKLLEMFTLQQTLNDETNGKNWESGYNKHNRIINWRRCIYMECAELIDSFNWKHWKDIQKEPDWDNVKIEVVDIWHFVMSLGLEYYKNNNLGDIKELVDYVGDTKYIKDFCKEPDLQDNSESLEIVNNIEHFMKDVLNGEDFYKIVDDFFQSASHCGLNLDILYKFYLAKNVLNQFRQDHGYKDGKYKKIWGDKEDNDVMLEILEDKILDAKALYVELEKRYQ